MKGNKSSFSFQTVTKGNTAKLTLNLDNKKAAQSMDIPTKLVKEFGCLISSFIASNVNKRINWGAYVNAFKKVEVRLLYKKDGKTIGPLVSFGMFQKFMKDPCMIKFILILIKYFQYVNAVSVKALTHSISF